MTVTNNGGSQIYLFTGNGTFTFEFIDQYGNTGSETATVNLIDKGTFFITTWRTTTVNESITVPTVHSVAPLYNFVIDWGDGTTGSYINLSDPSPTHAYAITGEHTITIMGTFPRIYVTNLPYYKNKILAVNQRGTNQRTSMENAFQGCANLQILATDTPDLSKVTYMRSMFAGATNLTGGLSNWDVSHVTNMSYMLQSASVFNEDLSNWDVANATEMSYMFSNATVFNSDLSGWDTSKVTNMSNMFNGAKGFNQPLNSWNTSKVTNMQQMFNGATNFNQNLSSWDVSKVTSMTNMLNNTALSTYNYNAVLDSRSQQSVKA